MNTIYKEWPEPPYDKNGAPKSWIVATHAFNNAAQVSMHIRDHDWELIIPQNPGDTRECYLIGYYDEDYSSFHIHRQFDDGSRDVVYNPSQSDKAADYRALLEIMEAWQIAAYTNVKQGRKVPELEKMEDFDPILYERLKL